MINKNIVFIFGLVCLGANAASFNDGDFDLDGIKDKIIISHNQSIQLEFTPSSSGKKIKYNLEYLNSADEGFTDLYKYNKKIIEFAKNGDNSISLQEMVNGINKNIDLYEVGDGVPRIETVFFDQIKNKRKLIVLVSWDEENISAIHYKIHVYNYTTEGALEKDELFSNDKNLEGYDGYSGNGMIFNLKNAGAIKGYLHG